MTEALDRLREAMAQKPLPLTPFVGMGLSSAATGGAAHASWRGLIADGIKVCERVVSPLPPGWASRMRDQLDNSDVISYIAAADEITRRLRVVRGGREFGYWIRRTVGGLHPTPEGEKIIKAVRSLGKAVVTTNYDTLIEDVKPRWNSKTWTDSDYAEAVGQTRMVLHLHGVVGKPDSVILSSADYERLSQDQLADVLNKSLFASHRFIFIGCGGSLSDPDIAPLIDFMNNLIPERKTEHYILVPGGQLRQLNERPLSPSISPVAYGSNFEELTQFLQKLVSHEEIDTSQDPEFYEEPATTKPISALLDLAAPAWEKLQDAQEALQRAIRTMGQVENRSKVPDGMNNWDYRDQRDVHEQLAASVTDPAAHLESSSAEVVRVFENAESYIGRLTAPQFAEYATQLKPMMDTVSKIENLSGQLLSRVKELRDDLRARTKLCTDYRVPHETVSRAYGSIIHASSIATSLGEGLDRLQEVHTAENPRVSRAAPKRRELYVVPSEQGEPAEPGVRFIPVLGKVAGGPLILTTGEDLEYVPLPAEYTHRDDAFAVKVKGESMREDGVHDGDYAILVPEPEPKDGEMVVVVAEGVEGVEEDSAAVKRLRLEGEVISLMSSTSNVEPIILTRDNNPVFYKVIGLMRWHIK
jgi:SOS-response transcriptional repressor LexA